MSALFADLSPRIREQLFDLGPVKAHMNAPGAVVVEGLTALYSLSTLRVLRDCLPADSAGRAAVETAVSAAQRIASDPNPGGQPGVLRALLAACTVNRVPAA